MVLRRTLWAAGVRYRLHVRGLPGRPDLVVTRPRVAIFCDGDFWHGRHWSRRRERLAAGWNAAYWVAKIERNRKRDRIVNGLLRRQGWLVLRIWEGDLRKDPVKTARRILTHVATRGDVTPAPGSTRGPTQPSIR